MSFKLHNSITGWLSIDSGTANRGNEPCRPNDASTEHPPTPSTLRAPELKVRPGPHSLAKDSVLVIRPSPQDGLLFAENDAAESVDGLSDVD
jgi:hypothetical protein